MSSTLAIMATAVSVQTHGTLDDIIDMQEHDPQNEKVLWEELGASTNAYEL